MDPAMIEVSLPRLVGTRPAVGHLLDEQHVPVDLSGERAVILCRDLVSGSASFADELVRVLLQERSADDLVLVAAPERFVELVSAAASSRGIGGRTSVGSAVELLG